MIYRATRPAVPLKPVKRVAAAVRDEPGAASRTRAGAGRAAPTPSPRHPPSRSPRRHRRRPHPKRLNRRALERGRWPRPRPRKRAQAAAVGASAPAAAAPPTAAASPRALEDVISRAMPAVVRVETASGFGSGFFIAPDTILTNVHVVGTNTTVTHPPSRRQDDDGARGSVPRRSSTSRCSAHESDCPPATLPLGGASARAGQEVIALGTPLGLSEHRHARHRQRGARVGGLTLVQTDAAINRATAAGRCSIARRGDRHHDDGVKSSEAQGLGFAVAIEHAQALLAGQRPTGMRGTPIATLNEALSGRLRAGHRQRARSRHDKPSSRRLRGWRSAPTRSTTNGAPSSASATRARVAPAGTTSGSRSAIRRRCRAPCRKAAPAFATCTRRRRRPRRRRRRRRERRARRTSTPARAASPAQRFRLDYPGWDR